MPKLVNLSSKLEKILNNEEISAEIEEEIRKDIDECNSTLVDDFKKANKDRKEKILSILCQCKKLRQKLLNKFKTLSLPILCTLQAEEEEKNNTRMDKLPFPTLNEDINAFLKSFDIWYSLTVDESKIASDKRSNQKAQVMLMCMGPKKDNIINLVETTTVTFDELKIKACQLWDPELTKGQLFEKFFNIRQNEKSIEEYDAALRKIANKISVKTTDDIFMYKFVHGIADATTKFELQKDSTYNNYEKCLKQAIVLQNLAKKQKVNKVDAKGKNNHPKDKVASNHSNKKQEGANKEKKEAKKKGCFFCGHPKHKQDQCWKKFPHLRPQKRADEVQASTSTTAANIGSINTQPY